jgi:uncharacterized membrane protein YidH (DUF202 family)
MTADDERADAGTARERTGLAWNRSGLAVIVCVAVLLRRAWPLPGTDEVVVLSILATAGIVWASLILVVGHNRRGRGDGFPLGERALRVMTAGTVVLAIGAVVLALLTPA